MNQEKKKVQKKINTVFIVFDFDQIKPRLHFTGISIHSKKKNVMGKQVYVFCTNFFKLR